MSIEVRSQPRRPDMTHLPAEVIEHFASLGAQVGLRKQSADSLGMDYTIGWRPVELDGLPADVAAAVRASFEIKSDHAHRGDCILAVRSLEARDHQREIAEEMRLAQEDDYRWVEGLEQELQQLARSTGRSTGRSILVGNVPHLRDQVIGGEKLAPVVADELRRERRGRQPRIA